MARKGVRIRDVWEKWCDEYPDELDKVRMVDNVSWLQTNDMPILAEGK